MSRKLLEGTAGGGRGVAFLAVAVIALGCNRAPAPLPQQLGPRPTPAPGFSGRVDSVPRESVLAYARSLTFDTVAPAVDRRYIVLAQGQQLTVGPFAELAPEIGAAAISRGDLARGRVLARVTLDAAVPGAGLEAGPAYVWVDSVPGGFMVNGVRRYFRAVYLPDRVGAALKVTPVSLTGPYGSTRNWCPAYAAARFMARRLPSPTALRTRSLSTTSRVMLYDCWPCDCTWCCPDTT